MITATYHAPLGDIQLVADERGLTGLWFVDERPSGLPGVLSQAMPVAPFRAQEPCESEVEAEEVVGADNESGAPGMSCESPCNAAALGVIERVWGWLNSYFAGQMPLWLPPLHLEGDELAHEVCAALLGVPYGESVTSAELAEHVNGRFVGNDAATIEADGIDAAVRALPVSLIVPAHRVDGACGSVGRALRDFERTSLRVR